MFGLGNNTSSPSNSEKAGVIAAVFLSLAIGDGGLAQDTGDGVSKALTSTGVLEGTGVTQRVWTDHSGRFTTNATLIAAKQGSVLLETADKNRVLVQISSLSPECQQYVETFRLIVPQEVPPVPPSLESLLPLEVSPGAKGYAAAWVVLMEHLTASGNDPTDVAMLFPQGSADALPTGFNPDDPNPDYIYAVTAGEEGVYWHNVTSQLNQRRSASYADFFGADFHPEYVATKMSRDTGITSNYVAANGASSWLSVVTVRQPSGVGEEASVEHMLEEAADPSGRPLRNITGLAFGEEGKLYVACSVGVVVFSENPLKAQKILDPGFTPTGVAAHHESGYVAAYSDAGEVAILAKDGDYWQRFSGPRSIKHIAFVAPKEVVVIRGDDRAAVAVAESVPISQNPSGHPHSPSPTMIAP